MASVCSEQLGLAGGQGAEGPHRAHHRPGGRRAHGAGVFATRPRTARAAQRQLPQEGARLRARPLCPQSVASAGHDCSLRFWDLDKREEILCIAEAHRGKITGLCAASDARMLASFGAEALVKVWSMGSHALLYSLQMGAGISDVAAMAWCSANQTWLTAGNDDCIRIWSKDHQVCRVKGTAWRLCRFLTRRVAVSCRAPQVSSLVVAEGGVNALYCDNARRVVLAATRRLSIVAISLENGAEHCSFKGHSDMIRTVAELEERKQYVSVAWDGGCVPFSFL